MDVINKMTSPQNSKEEAQALLGILYFGGNAYSEFQPDCKPEVTQKKNNFKFQVGP